MKNLISLIILFGLLSVSNKLVAQDISVDKFSKIPRYIDGCGCFFYLKKSDEYYIFVSMAGGDAAMKIDGSMQRLKPIDENYDNGYYGKFSNKKYEIEMKGKKTGDYGEGSDYKGKMTVRNKDTNAKITIKFVGSCGC